MGGVTGLDASASLAGEEPKLAQLWDAFVQANRHLTELRFGDMLAGRLSLARREAEHTEDYDDDDDGLLLDQPDDWMDGANMRRRGAAREEQEEDTTWNADHNWAGYRVDEVEHELERGPMWIANAKKAAAGTGRVTDIPHVAPDSLNERQRNCYDVVKHHFENGGEPLRMMVLGTAGTGKSYLVYALSRLLGGFLRRAAPTGMAGFLIAGSTLHSLLRLPVRQGKNLQGQSLKALQTSLAGVKYIIIDELSMVSQAQFAWVDRRLRQGTAVDEPFGGISVIMTGDLGQLQPVGGTPLYKQNPTAALNVEGYAAYSGFKDVFQSSAADGRRRQRRRPEGLHRAAAACS